MDMCIDRHIMFILALYLIILEPIFFYLLLYNVCIGYKGETFIGHDIRNIVIWKTI